MRKDKSFCNFFWLCNFMVFDTIKFVTFRKSRGHTLELHAKTKKLLDFRVKLNFSTKNLKTLWPTCMYGWDLTVSRLQSHYEKTVCFVPLSLRSF